ERNRPGMETTGGSESGRDALRLLFPAQEPSRPAASAGGSASVTGSGGWSSALPGAVAPTGVVPVAAGLRGEDLSQVVGGLDDASPATAAAPEPRPALGSSDATIRADAGGDARATITVPITGIGTQVGAISTHVDSVTYSAPVLIEVPG